jgi:hypothetical protein
VQLWCGNRQILTFSIELPKMAPLSFDANGDFKILQLADLHFTNEEGVCRDIPAGVRSCFMHFITADKKLTQFIQ